MITKQMVEAAARAIVLEIGRGTPPVEYELKLGRQLARAALEAATALSQADGARVAEMRGALSGVIICYHAGLFKGHEDEPWIQRVLATSEIQNPTRPREQEGAEPVAWRYRWKLDGEWTKWRVSDASQKHPAIPGIEEVPLYAHPLPAASFQAPNGWQLVPIEPTGEMLGIGQHFYDKTTCGLVDGDDPMAEAWSRMLGRAPAPPAVAASFQAGAEGWIYDMDAAPRDGTRVLLYHPDTSDDSNEVEAGRWGIWDHRSPCWCMDSGEAWMTAKAWQPLPIPASSEGR